MFDNRIVLKALVFLAIITGESSAVISQEIYNYPAINAKTYSEYINGQWKDLIKTGKKSKKAGIEFYYLQIRMGIAYYELKKYRQAVAYFEKAFAASPEDDFIQEYLYFSYLFSGRYNDSQKLALKFSNALNEKLQLSPKKGISALGLEMKFDNWNDYQVNVSNSDRLTQNVQKKYGYFSLGLENVFKNSSNLLLSYSRIAVTEDFNLVNSSNTRISGENDISQNQLFLKYGANFSKGLNFVISGNFLYIAVNEKLPIQSGSGGGMSSRSNRTASSEFVAFTSLSKDFSLFRLGVFSSISNLDKNLQIQPGISFTYYPLGNTKLYTLSVLHNQFENSGNFRLTRTVFRQGVGVGMWGVYVEPSITFGELVNFIEGEGFIVNNSKDLVKNRYEILAYTWLLKGRLNVFFKYQNYTRQNDYRLNTTINSIDYNYKTLTGGIKWNF